MNDFKRTECAPRHLVMFTGTPFTLHIGNPSQDAQTDN